MKQRIIDVDLKAYMAQNASIGCSELKARGNAAFRSGKYEEALEDYCACLQRCTASESTIAEQALMNSSACHTKLCNFEAAFSAAREARSRNDSLAKAWFRELEALCNIKPPMIAAINDCCSSLERCINLGRFSRGDAEQLQRQSQRLKQYSSRHVVQPQKCTASASEQPATTSKSTAASSSIKSVKSSTTGAPALAEELSHPARSPQPHSAASLATRLFPQSEFQRSADGQSTNILILLHGLGDGPAPYLRLAKAMQLPQTDVLSLCGPVQLPLDMGHGWFEAFDPTDFSLLAPARPSQPSAELGDLPRMASLMQTRGMFVELVQGLQAHYPAERIHLYGFAQGGTFALDATLMLACMYDICVGSCASIAGPVMPEVRWDVCGEARRLRGGTGRAKPWTSTAAPAQIHICLLRGADDKLVSTQEITDSVCGWEVRRSLGV